MVSKYICVESILRKSINTSVLESCELNEETTPLMAAVVVGSYGIRIQNRIQSIQDKKLDPFFIVNTSDAITMENIHFCIPNQNALPCRVDGTSNRICNPEEVLEHIMKSPSTRYLLCTNLNHVYVEWNEKRYVSSTRILYCRTFMCNEKMGMIWVSKVVGLPFGYVFDRESNEEVLIKYLTQCSPILSDIK